MPLAKQDIAHLREHLPSDITVQELSNRALLALQGPTAVNVMAELAPQTTELTFMTSCVATIAGVDCYVSRSGYTGEDGFEISIPSEDANTIARILLGYDRVEPIGLGARDSLRLEAGLCLYGHDMNETTSPVEASLLFSISKSRRPDGNKAGGLLVSKRLPIKRRREVCALIEGPVPIRRHGVSYLGRRQSRLRY